MGDLHPKQQRLAGRSRNARSSPPAGSARALRLRPSLVEARLRGLGTGLARCRAGSLRAARTPVPPIKASLGCWSGVQVEPWLRRTGLNTRARADAQTPGGRRV